MPAKVKYVSYPKVAITKEEKAWLDNITKSREDLTNLSDTIRALTFDGNSEVAEDNKILKEQIMNCINIINQVSTLDNNIKYMAWLEEVEAMNEVVSEVLNKITLQED